MLEAALALRLGTLALRLELGVGAGEVLALVGPNGAGKTTTLRALSGALRLAEGRIALDGRVLDEPARGVFVPPEERAVGMVFQDRLLFPHLWWLNGGLRCSQIGPFVVYKADHVSECGEIA